MRSSVRVIVPGHIEEIKVRPGQRVEAGQLLVQLSNPDVDLVIAELEGKLAVFRPSTHGLQRQQFRNDAAALQIPAVRELIDSTKEVARC